MLIWMITNSNHYTILSSSTLNHLRYLLSYFLIDGRYMLDRNSVILADYQWGSAQCCKSHYIRSRHLLSKVVVPISLVKSLMYVILQHIPTEQALLSSTDKFRIVWLVGFCLIEAFSLPRTCLEHWRSVYRAGLCILGTVQRRCRNTYNYTNRREHLWISEVVLRSTRSLLETTEQ